MYLQDLDIVRIALNKPRTSRGGRTIPTGVVCPYCGKFGLIYVGKKLWHCSSCDIIKTSEEIESDITKALGESNV